MHIILLSLLIFIFTTIMAVAGVGAAFIVIPLINYSNYDLLIAMAIGLLSNTVSTGTSSLRHAKEKKIEYKQAIPIILMSIIFTYVGAYFSTLIPRAELKLVFGIILFLLGTNMFIKVIRSQEETVGEYHINLDAKNLIISLLLGSIIGFLAGLLGIGGGSIVLPLLLYLGYPTKRAAATTSFIVLFSSFTGFLSKVSVITEPIPVDLLWGSLIATILGAALGSYLMHYKLNRKQIKLTIALMLLIVSLKIIIDYFI